jgi:hypothetical protein
MQAVWTAMHALLAGTGIVLLGLLGGPTEAWLAAVTGAVTLASVLLCNWIYARALDRGRRSDDRVIGDRRRAFAMFIALPLPTAYALIAVLDSGFRPGHETLQANAVAAFVAGLAVIALALLYVSSTIDWYIIRAWRDGIVCDPPCQRIGNRTTWLLITRIWLLHRIVATIGFFVGLWTAVGLAWFELAKHHGKSDWAIYLLGLVSPSAIPLFFMSSYIANLGHAVGLAFGNLRVSLGDRVSWSDDGRNYDGIVYDVSIDAGYRVIDREGKASYLPLSRARSGSVSIDETDPEPWACAAVRKSGLMGATDPWTARDHPSTRWLIIR